VSPIAFARLAPLGVELMFIDPLNVVMQTVGLKPPHESPHRAVASNVGEGLRVSCQSANHALGAPQAPRRQPYRCSSRSRSATTTRHGHSDTIASGMDLIGPED
jgi:hypothetical protein